MKKIITKSIIILVVIVLGFIIYNNQNTNKYVVGISQFAEHPSLDNCREGFIAGLKEESIIEGKNLKIIYSNADADVSLANTITQNFISKKVNLINAIATPSAQAAFNVVDGTDVPVVFTAVANPISAGIAKSDGSPAGNITGISDETPIEDQIKMMRKILPNAKKMGIIYTTSEANSTYALEIYHDLAPQYGFQIVEVGISTSSDIPFAVDSIINKVDCINSIPDNTVVSSLSIIIDKANAKKIPVFGSEEEQVKKGCLASVGLNYFEVGRKSGIIAAKVLKGEIKANEYNFDKVKESKLSINTKVAANLNITLSEDILSEADYKFDSIN